MQNTINNPDVIVDTFKTIKDFYSLDGLYGTVEHITDLLTNFLYSYDEETEFDSDKKLSSPTAWGEEYIKTKVHFSCETIKFFIKLKENLERVEHTNGKLPS